MSKAKNRNRKKTLTLADQADRHHLYELSVQCAEAEIDFVEHTFGKCKKRKALILREDFCGTANVCCEWVKRSKKRSAIGIDLDAEVLEWGRTHQLSQLTAGQRKRVTLVQENVLDAKTGAPDIISAMNFSYWLFKERNQLKTYFASTLDALKDDGMLFLDAYGGYDSFREIEEAREIDDGADGFTYIWEQSHFNPVNHNLHCNIHFAFSDDSRLDQAFSYDWRLWTPPEIRDLLEEVGFRKVTIYWQGWDEDGEADGDFVAAENGDADAGWICYITAEK